jgi:lysophospholipase L1-like esterase
MKKYLSISLLLTTILVMSCQQEIAELTPPVQETGGEPGSANFTMFVSVGNSLTAGFQAGALFTEGQNNSYPAIMAKQFALVSENDEFNQPDINSVNGFNSTFSNPGGGVIRGRLVLFDSDGTGPKTPSPAPAGTPGIPAPYNTADLPAAFAGDKTKLNNFGVPGILLGQCLTPLTGGPSSGNPAYNALYERFASNPGTSTILGDAIAKNPTFFSFWLGNNDVLGYATTGGSGAIPLTDQAAFQGQYTTAINQLLAANANVKGIVATIPYVTSIPFFTTVKFNAIPLDAATATAVNGGFAGYNAALTGIQSFPSANLTALGLTVAGLEARKVTFAAVSNNPILIVDKDLVDLGPAFDALLGAGAINSTQRAQLAPLQRARQATSADIITLSAGSILGTVVGGNPLAVNGVSVPLADQFVLLPSESTAIKNRIDAFNTIIRDVVTANTSRLALADMNAKFNDVVNRVVVNVDGIPVNATFAPPTGLFSEDGVHPNNRGSAYIARIFIEAINAKFGSTVPLPSIATYKSTPLPVSPL